MAPGERRHHFRCNSESQTGESQTWIAIRHKYRARCHSLCVSEPHGTMSSVKVYLRTRRYRLERLCQTPRNQPRVKRHKPSRVRRKVIIRKLWLRSSSLSRYSISSPIRSHPERDIAHANEDTHENFISLSAHIHVQIHTHAHTHMSFHTYGEEMEPVKRKNSLTHSFHLKIAR